MRRSTHAAALLALLGSAIAASAAGGDAKRGLQAFSACQTCHTVTRGGANGIGPNLFGIAGRKAASLPGFYYSPALKNSKIIWTNDKLKAWVMAPYRLVPGTRMTFAGIQDPAKATDVVAYLGTLK
jgi:cytochrome c